MAAIWLEVGGAASSINDNSCQRLAALGARGVHCVVPDMGTYQAQINSIKKYGMVGTLDVEVPLWVNTGFNVNADLSPYLPQLKAQAAAGWSYFAFEGIGRAGVATIGSVRPCINYGDENGANMYAGEYNHAPNAHFANLLETYHKYAIDAYKASTAVAKANCPRYGLTLMMYNPSDLEQDTTALIDYINQIGGVQDTLMWTGVVTDILSVFNQPWLGIVNALKNAFGFRSDLPWTTVTPPPPPPVSVNPIASIFTRFQFEKSIGLMKIQGWAYDKAGKPTTAATGLWGQFNSTSAPWKGYLWATPRASDGYFEYDLTKLAHGNYYLRIQTNGPIFAFPTLTNIDLW
jgi:hypothetical protein